MATQIELWINGKFVSAVEEWWETVESGIPSDAVFPILRGITGYDDYKFVGNEIHALRAEVRRLKSIASGGLRSFIHDLDDLCATAEGGSRSVIFFHGD